MYPYKEEWSAQWNHSDAHSCVLLLCGDAVIVTMSTLYGFDLVMGNVVNTQIPVQLMRSAVKTR